MNAHFSPRPLPASPCSRGFLRTAVLGLAAALLASSAHAAFHLWVIQELFTNLDGTQQFIELSTNTSGQGGLGNVQFKVVQQGTNVTHTFTFPTGLAGDTTNHTFLLATAGLQAAGGPTPDYTIPSDFLFANGGTVDLVGAVQGVVSYNALPTDGITSLVVPANTTQVNSPKDFAGTSGTVPEPSTWGVLGLSGMGVLFLLRRRTA